MIPCRMTLFLLGRRQDPFEHSRGLSTVDTCTLINLYSRTGQFSSLRRVSPTNHVTHCNIRKARNALKVKCQSAAKQVYPFRPITHCLHLYSVYNAWEDNIPSCVRTTTPSPGRRSILERYDAQKHSLTTAKDSDAGKDTKIQKEGHSC